MSILDRVLNWVAPKAQRLAAESGEVILDLRMDAKRQGSEFWRWFFAASGFVLLLWLLNLVWVKSWHSINNGSQVANGFGPISALFSGLSAAGVVAAFFFQRKAFVTALESSTKANEQAERARVDKAERFARTFMSPDMRVARNNAWAGRTRFLKANERTRSELAREWLDATNHREADPNMLVIPVTDSWNLSMMVEYYVWMCRFCISLPIAKQSDEAKYLARLYSWHWWRGYILLMARYVTAEYIKMTADLSDVERENFPPYAWIEDLAAFDIIVGLNPSTPTNLIDDYILANRPDNGVTP